MHPSLHLRAATPADCITLSALAIQVYLHTYATQGVRPELAREALRDFSTEAFLHRLDEPGCRYVLAEIGTGLVGFAEVDLHAGPAPCSTLTGAELRRLYVQPAVQRMGIGARLIGEAERLAAQAGLPSLWLTAWDGNQQALAFFARHGYADQGATVHVIEGQRIGNRVLQRLL